MAGNLLGGRSEDPHLGATLLTTAVVAAASLAVRGPASATAATAVALWQLAAYRFPPAVQLRINQDGRRATDFAVSPSLHLGVVVGPGLGGVALTAGGLGAVTTTAAVLVWAPWGSCCCSA